MGKMTKNQIEARKIKVMENIAKGGGYNTVDWQNQRKAEWNDEIDDKRKRVA